MGSRKVIFAEGEYYHVYNCGVDKRVIFRDAQDFRRFLEAMRLFNAIEPSISVQLQRKLQHGSVSLTTAPEPLVRILCYCLNRNHFHFLLEQVADRGIEQLMQRLGGYTLYVNKRYKRSGVLFQGKFKARHIDSDAYFVHESVYVNLNNRVHRLANSVAFRSSWDQYVGDVTTQNPADYVPCATESILSQFASKEEYRQYAEQTLPTIQARKDMLSELEEEPLTS